MFGKRCQRETMGSAGSTRGASGRTANRPASDSCTYSRSRKCDSEVSTNSKSNTHPIQDEARNVDRVERHVHFFSICKNI